jgi:hypothetical protein
MLEVRILHAMAAKTHVHKSLLYRSAANDGLVLPGDYPTWFEQDQVA